MFYHINLMVTFTLTGGEPGDFLVRAGAQPGMYSLSVR